MDGNFGFGLLNFTSGEYYDVFTPGFERFASFEVRQAQGVQFSEPFGLEPCTTENMVCISAFDRIAMTPESTLLITMSDCDSVSLEECASLQERS